MIDPTILLKMPRNSPFTTSSEHFSEMCPEFSVQALSGGLIFNRREELLQRMV